MNANGNNSGNRYKPLVKLTGLYENKSRKSGDTYFTGYLGAAKVVILRDTRAEPGKPGWNLFVQEREPKGNQGQGYGQQGHGYQGQENGQGQNFYGQGSQSQEQGFQGQEEASQGQEQGFHGHGQSYQGHGYQQPQPPVQHPPTTSTGDDIPF